MPQLDIKAPDGTVYKWTKPTPPTQADLDALAAYHAKTHPDSKPLGRPSGNGDPLGDPADAPGYVPPPPLSPVAKPAKKAGVLKPNDAFSKAILSPVAFLFDDSPSPAAAQEISALRALQNKHRQTMRTGNKQARIAAKAGLDATEQRIRYLKSGGNPFADRDDEGIVALQELRTAKDDMTPEMAAYLGELATSAVPKAFRRISGGISKAIGNGPIDPSVYDNRAPLASAEGASRALSRAVDFSQYLVPGVNAIPLAGQALHASAGLATDPMSVAKGLVEGLNFVEPGIDPEERFFRLANLGLTVVGGLHAKVMISDAVAAQRLASARGMDLEVAMAAVKAARATQAHYNAKSVAKLDDAARSAALRRGEGQAPPAAPPARVAAREVPGANPAADLPGLGRTAAAADARGLVPPGPLDGLAYAAEPTRPKPGIKGRSNVRKSGPPGEPPRLIGEEPAAASPLMPNGEPLVRNETDLARLQAMREEFGAEEGLNRYVADRSASKPPAREVDLTTGDEMARSEHEALSRKLERMKADRAALDEAPNLPANVRESMVRSVDPDGETLDPFSERYDDGLASTLHQVLFEEHPPRGRDGDVSEAALARIRDELRTDQQAAFFRETLAGERAHPEDADHVQDLAMRSRALRDPETRKDYIPDVDERDVPDSPEDWITAKRANNRRGWKVNGRRVNMVGLEGVHPETARALVEHALSAESDGSFLRRSDYLKYKRSGIKPTMRKLSELIEKEVGGDWRRSDFEGWSRIQIPRSVVANYVRGRLAEAGLAREVLQSIAPGLTEAEIQNVVEYHAQGRELPRNARGDGRASLDRGEGGPEPGNAAEGDRGSGRPASPRQPARERLDAEISALEGRLGRAKVQEDSPARILRPGEPEGPAPQLLGPSGRPVRETATPKRERVRAKAAAKAEPKIEAAPATPRKAAASEQPPLLEAEPGGKPEPKAERPTEKPSKRERATPEEEPNPAETRNADTEAERAAAGTAPVERQAYITKAMADEAGRKSVKAGRNYEALAESIAAKPRPITAVENGVLRAGRARLFEQAREATRLRREAQVRGDFEAAGEHHEEYLRLRALIDRNTEALVKGGRELSAAFGARRGEETVDLADPEAVVQEARWAAGKGDRPVELNPKVDKRLREMADELADLERRRGDEAKARERAEKELARFKEDRHAARVARRTDLKAEMEDLKGQLAKSLLSTANSGLPVEAVAIVGKMARNAVQQGALTLAEMVERVRSELPEEVAAEIDDRDILDAFSGHGRPPESRAASDARARIEELKRLARTSSEIEDAAAGHRPPPRTKAAVSDELAALRKVRDELRKEKGLDRKTTRVRRAVEDVVAALEKRAAEVDAATARGEAAGPVGAARAAEDAAIVAARARLRTALAKNRVSSSIRDLEAQLASGKFKEPTGRTLPDKETQDLVYRRDRLRREIRETIEAQKPKTVAKKVGGVLMEAAGAVRTFKTSFDLSAPLRQGAMLTLANPKEAARAFGEQLRAFKDPAYAHAANEAILRGPDAKGFAEAGLYLSDPEAGPLTSHEEGFISKWAGKIPGVGASERAYTAYLNTIRADVFKKLTEGKGLTIEERQAVANYINVATGRGHLPGFEKSAGSLANILFSPRYLTSRFEILIGQPFWKGSARSRGIVAKEYAKYAGAVLAVVALAKARGAAVSTDPENPDFLKMKIGNTRVDVLAGLQQALRFALRMGSGKSDSEQVAKRFVRSKLAPVAGYAWSAKTGKDFTGAPFSLKETAKDIATPMLVADTYEAIRAQGIPKGLALGVLSGLGLSVSTYKPKD